MIAPAAGLPPSPPQRKRWWLPVILLVVLGIPVALLLRKSEPPKLVVFPSAQLPRESVPLPDRWIPMSWGWYWRAKTYVLGAPKPFTVAVSIAEADVTKNAGLLPKDLALTNTSGLRVWLVDKAELDRLRQDWAASGVVLAKPRASLADGISASVSTSGPQQPGSNITIERTVSLRPRSRGETTDLSVGVLFTEKLATPRATVASINPQRTNTLFAVRAQIPADQALCLLKEADGPGDKSLCVLIEVTSPRTGKR